MDSDKKPQILVISAQHLLLQIASLAIRHARRALQFRYPEIQMNAYIVFLLANTLVVDATAEMLKMSG